MSRRPPPRKGDFFGYGDLGLGSFQDINGGGLDPSSAAMDLSQMGTDGQDGSELMSLFGSNMLCSFGDIPMTLDPVDDNAMSHFNSGTGTEDAVARSESQFNTAANNVQGAGPLLPGPVTQSIGATGGSTLNEFTKRRNWPAKVVEELKDFLQILDANGRIKFASSSIMSLAGYAPDEVQDVFLKDLIHPDDQGVFVAELNESIASGNPTRLFYRLKKKDGSYAIFEAVGHAHIAAAKFAPNPSNQSPFCQAVFMMARPYPTKNAGLLDSFLEHKVENERLKRRIAELRREEEAENDEAQRQWRQSQSLDTRSEMTPSESAAASSTPFYRGSSERSFTQAERAPLNTPLTRENLEGAVAGSRPDSIRDKMARYEGASHTDTIEMLTGLRYIEGERSRGITTGNASPTLIKGDVGIAIPVDRDPRVAEKKKKLKTSEEYVCTDCGKCLRSTIVRLAHNLGGGFVARKEADGWQEPSTPPSGGKARVAQRHCAMPADCGGRRRRRRRTRRARPTRRRWLTAPWHSGVGLSLSFFPSSVTDGRNASSFRRQKKKGKGSGGRREREVGKAPGRCAAGRLARSHPFFFVFEICCIWCKPF